MNVLITGAARFIGRKLAVVLSTAGDNVTALDNLSPQIHGANADWPGVLKDLPNVSLVRGNVNNADLIKDLVDECDMIVHLAAETGADQSMCEIIKYSHANVSGSALLLETASQRRPQIKKFVFAFSRFVYGEGSYIDAENAIHFPAPRSPKNLSARMWNHYSADGKRLAPIGTRESHNISPVSIYAATKYAVELYCRIVPESYCIPIDVLRFQNVYGEGQSLKNPYTGILSIFSNLLRQDKEINIFEDGEESRDFIHVSDVVRAIEKSLRIQSSGFRVFTIGVGKSTSVMEIA